MIESINSLPDGAGAAGIIVPSVFASIVAFVKWYLPWRQKAKVRVKSLNELRSIQRIYSIMNEQIVETAAERVVIFAGHDSGEIPEAGSPYFISSIYWKVRHDQSHHPKKDVTKLDIQTHHDIADYREVSADAHYIDMLLEIQDKGTIRLKTQDLPEDCILKSYYDLESITDSIVIYLGYNKNNLIYMSVATFKKEGFDKEDVLRLKLKSLRIKQELGFTK